MNATRILKVDPVNPQAEYVKEAGEALRKGRLVIIPTETVYGVAANMLDNNAIERLYRIKQRLKEKPFSVHVGNKEDVEEFARDVPIAAYKLMEKFWPGPLTLVLKAKAGGTIGLRMPDNEVALRVISAANVPVVCPSANISGEPSTADFSQAIKGLDGLVDLAIDAGPARLGVESSVVDLTQKPLRILREAAIKREEIEATTNKKTVLFVCTGNSCRSVMAKALLEKRLKQDNRTNIEVISRGIMMMAGLGATGETREVLMAEGLDVSDHRSQRIDRGVIRKSDLILVMEKIHEEKILQIAPEAKNRVFLLKEFAKIDAQNRNLEITDPIGKSLEFYAQTFDMIKEAVERVARII